MRRAHPLDLPMDTRYRLSLGVNKPLLSVMKMSPISLTWCEQTLTVSNEDVTNLSLAWCEQTLAVSYEDVTNLSM